MARDKLGFEAGRKRDAQGRPLKLCTPPASEAYRDNWERTFGKPKEDAVMEERVREALNGD